MKLLAWLLCVLIWICAMTLHAYAASLFEWDRNIEADLDHYELYVCSTSATCVPGTTTLDRLGSDIPQPAIGTKPTMLIPVGKEGRAAAIAVDLSGNKSGLSNIVPFDTKSPTIPTGLLTK